MENPRQGEDSQEGRKPAGTVTQWALGLKHGMGRLSLVFGDYSSGVSPWLGDV